MDENRARVHDVVSNRGPARYTVTFVASIVGSHILRRSILLGIAVPLLSLVALSDGARAEQFGFPDGPRRGVHRTQPTKAQTVPAPVVTTQTVEAQSVAFPTGEPTVNVDKTSGRYLQSVGRHVADRPLACPPHRITRH